MKTIADETSTHDHEILNLVDFLVTDTVIDRHSILFATLVLIFVIMENVEKIN